MFARSLALSLALSMAPPLRVRVAASGVNVFGRVQDARTRAPLPFLTVQLFAERDRAFVAGRLTDTTGAFTFTVLKKGVYLLEARRIGYVPLR